MNKTHLRKERKELRDAIKEERGRGPGNQRSTGGRAEGRRERKGRVQRREARSERAAYRRRGGGAS